jgi:hypothetical protein
MIKTYKDLVNKVNKFKIDKSIDLSSGEDLSIGIMNLISIEEHLFYTSQKLKSPKYLKMLNEVRLMRTELMKNIVKDPEGEVWCISKHLLSASMRLMEVGTKELKKGNDGKAWKLFEKSYKLYFLFWGLNLSKNDKLQMTNDKLNYIDENGKSKGTESVFSKLGNVVQKALDCCRE